MPPDRDRREVPRPMWRGAHPDPIARQPQTSKDNTGNGLPAAHMGGVGSNRYPHPAPEENPMTTTTTAPTGAPEQPIRVIADDAALLARAARALHGKHVVCNLDEPDPDDPCDGVVELWSIGDHTHVAELQRLLAAAGIPSTVLTTEVLDPATPEVPRDARTLAAYHEAGHAIAGCMRGSILRSITLGEEDGSGLTVHREPAGGDSCTSYAGPWAEARFIWGDRPADEEDEDYLTLAGHLFGVFLGAGAEDWQEVSEHFAGLAELAGLLPPEITVDDLVRLTEQVWARELQAVWPAIETVATSLLAGAEITHASVGEAIRVCLIRSLRELA